MRSSGVPSPVGTTAGLEAESPFIGRCMVQEGVGGRVGLPAGTFIANLTSRFGGDSCRQHGFWSFLRTQQSLKKILYYNNNNINLSYFCVFFFHFFWGLGWERRGRKSVIRLLGPEQRELLCGWVRPPAALGVGPLLWREAGQHPSGKLASIWNFSGLSFKENKKSWITCRGHREKKGSEKTHTHTPTMKSNIAFSRMTWRYKITALQWNFISKIHPFHRANMQGSSF